MSLNDDIEVDRNRRTVQITIAYMLIGFPIVGAIAFIAYYFAISKEESAQTRSDLAASKTEAEIQQTITDEIETENRIIRETREVEAGIVP